MACSSSRRGPEERAVTLKRQTMEAADSDESHLDELGAPAGNVRRLEVELLQHRSGRFALVAPERVPDESSAASGRKGKSRDEYGSRQSLRFCALSIITAIRR